MARRVFRSGRYKKIKSLVHKIYEFRASLNKTKTKEGRIDILRQAALENCGFDFEKYKKLREKKHYVKNEACKICGQEADYKHHIIPLSSGGNNRSINLMPICHKCHEEIHGKYEKNEKTLQELGYWALRE
jgi:hypothetical protein